MLVLTITNTSLSDTPLPNSEINKKPNTAKLGMVLGVIVAILDFYAFELLDIDVSINGEPAFWFAFIILSLTYALLGYIAGRLYETKKHLMLKNELIKKQYLALKESQEKTLHYEKLASIGRLAAGVAHEVRNPLGVIRSAAGLIYEESPLLSENAKKSCDFIQAEISRLDHFIEQLLDFSKPLSPQVEWIEFCDTRRYLEDLLSTEQKSRSIAIEYEVASSLPTFEADISLLTQMLYSLIKNAMETSGSDRVLVSVTSDKRDIIIRVQDDGVGVSETAITRLFEPFYTTKAQGTGLGLAMAERVLKGHGGTIAYESGAGLGVTGNGACFRVTIPIRSKEHLLGKSDEK